MSLGEKATNTIHETARLHAEFQLKRIAGFESSAIAKSAETILKAYKEAANRVKNQKQIIPVAEWLLDNFYLIEEQIKDIKLFGTKKYKNKLPVITNEKNQVIPRIYRVAESLINALNLSISEDGIVDYLNEYQTITYLQNNELGSVMLMLRICLIKRTAHIANSILEDQQNREMAESWATQLCDVASDTQALQKHIQVHNKTVKYITPSYLHHFIRKLKEYDQGINMLSWIEGRVALQNVTTEEILSQYYEKQREEQLEIGELIGAFRMLAKIRWENLFEKISLLHEKLKQDPHGIYMNMMPESKQYYRQEIENIARKAKVNELYVANKAIDCALEEKEKQTDDVFKTHVGYFIIDDGKDELMHQLGVNNKRSVKKTFQKIYIPSIILVTISVAYLLSLKESGMKQWYYFFILLIPLSNVVIQIINRLSTTVVKPAHIPKMEFEDEIPYEYKTMVVIPALIVSKEAANELFVQMEVNCLANHKNNLLYAILGDFKDDQQEVTENDQDILDYCKKRVHELNNKFEHERPFFFFHRKRTYNEVDNVWSGWERKRGALIDFNTFLLSGKADRFLAVEGDCSLLYDIRFVLTLDADTKLPRDSASKLIGALAHVLNRPMLDTTGKQHGYGLLQPAIGVSVDTANKTLFSVTYSGQTGIDPYTTSVSDVYQDLFSEGTYTGKGIYDLNLFEEKTASMFPDNLILSHDLIEGSHVKTGLVTDVELIDGYPSGYIAYGRRLHRWTRGDWQIISRLNPIVRNRYNEKIINNISLIAKWKIIDNMRRSLVSPVLLILFFYGSLFATSALWGIVFSGALLLPLIMQEMRIFFIKSNQHTTSFKNRYIIDQSKLFFEEVLMTFTFLPHQAFLMLDAISRSVYRMTISKKNMLEWMTAADSERKAKKNGVGAHLSEMWVSVGTAGLLFVAKLITQKPFHLFDVIGIVLWTIAPWLAWYVSKPLNNRQYKPTDEQIELLRKISIKTWAFFEVLSKRKDHFLPPDNYQEEPYRGIAHRTSPTNIGLYLLAIASASDLGYIPITGSVYRIERTKKSIEKLEKWNGHLFNWYDTLTLKTLEPRYVSAVDSGNFGCCLLALAMTLKDYEITPIMTPQKLQGIADLHILNDYEHNSLLEYVADNNNYFNWMMVGAVLKEINEKHNGEIREIKEYCHAYQTLFPWAEIVVKESVNINGDAVRALKSLLKESCTIQKFIHSYDQIISAVSRCMKEAKKAINEETNDIQFITKLEEAVVDGYVNMRKFKKKCHDIAEWAEKMVYDTNFTKIYNHNCDLFPIGFDVTDGKQSPSYYDLLATEARQASFLAIAKGDVPQRHWFRLGRPLTIINETRGLLSWSGTMFEYFMPCLLMKTYSNTLLSETYEAVIHAQRRYGEMKHIPWGVSESAFYSFDFNLDYQYKAFGIPDLGFKRGLNEDSVVAPYATILALCHAPEQSIHNLHVLIQAGMEGEYGLYEAIDYSERRLTARRKKQVVKSYMAHHQGMIFLAINNYLNNNIMQQRFHDVPIIKATELLLQERMPSKEVFIKDYQYDPEVDANDNRLPTEEACRTYPYNTQDPEGHLLSNGRYSVFINNRGSGFSTIRQVQINRWESDAATDQYGVFFYLKNLESDKIWSTGYKPTCTKPTSYKATFTSGKAKILREDGAFETCMEIAVSRRDDVEVRRITVKNKGDKDATIDVTAYLEPILANFQDERAHPAFMNLFIETNYLSDHQMMMVSRRAGAKQYPQSRLGIQFLSENMQANNQEYETQRVHFLGRNQSIEQPEGVVQPEKLSESTGAVIDACVAIRNRVHLEAHQKVSFKLLIIPGRNEEEIIEIADAYRTQENINKLFELARAHSHVELEQLGASSREGMVYQSILSRVMYRNKKTNSRMTRFSRERLWKFGISGDIPIVLVLISKPQHIDQATIMAKAHQYWRTKGMKTDLIVVDSMDNQQEQHERERLSDLIRMHCVGDSLNTHAGIFMFEQNALQPNEMNLFKQVAEIVVDFNDVQTVEEYLSKHPNQIRPIEDEIEHKRLNNQKIEEKRLSLYNGIGGFACAGREYQMYLGKQQATPMPWSNIVSSKKIGFIATEAGGGYTWFDNSRQYKLTPWRNDPITDMPAEVVYIRDTQDHSLWTIPRMPCGHQKEDSVTHGWGYTLYRANCNDLQQQQKVYLANDSTKVIEIVIKNVSNKIKELKITGFVEWILGVNKQTAGQIAVKFENGTWYAKNNYHSPNQPAVYFTSSEKVESFICNKCDFLGIKGSFNCPAYDWNSQIEAKEVWVRGDCGVLQSSIRIQPNETKHLYYLIGVLDRKDKSSNAMTFPLSNIKGVLEKQVEQWKRLLQKITVHTPDTAFNTMMNGWLMYQALSSRVNGKTGYYQAGGAYGFRDQLQDMMAILYMDTERVRQHIITSCEHQFEEGDVQHWWHPPVSGVRTKITDDRLFLPYVVSEYIRVTADETILEEQAPFLRERMLKEEEKDIYSQPDRPEYTQSVLEHCIRAINCSLTKGSHGLPLMGGGDWNDGMDKVGENGGESVWLGWFTVFVIDCFLPICEKHGREENAKMYETYQKEVIEALDEAAWDGQWYRRAFYGDGKPLGSQNNKECRIDLIAQSWAAICGRGDKEKARKAIQSAQDYLVKKEEGLICLLAPSFNKTDRDPGYIKGYIPGVRENGGQYTHGAIWLVMGMLTLGLYDEAWELYSMINPINHARTKLEVNTYKVEPYVMAADVSNNDQHRGRGGWTWYTGSASWMYKVGLEFILGIKVIGDKLMLQPGIPSVWNDVSITMEKGASSYSIVYQRKETKSQTTFDGEIVNPKEIPFVDDGKRHKINMSLEI